MQFGNIIKEATKITKKLETFTTSGREWKLITVALHSHCNMNYNSKSRYPGPRIISNGKTKVSDLILSFYYMTYKFALRNLKQETGAIHFPYFFLTRTKIQVDH